MSTKTVYIQLLGEENCNQKAYVLKLSDLPIEYLETQLKMNYEDRQKYKNGEPDPTGDFDITLGYIPFKAIYKFEGSYNQSYIPSENEELVYVRSVPLFY